MVLAEERVDCGFFFVRSEGVWIEGVCSPSAEFGGHRLERLPRGRHYTDPRFPDFYWEWNVVCEDR